MNDEEISPLATDKQVPRKEHMNFQWQRAAGFIGKVAGSRVQVPAGCTQQERLVTLPSTMERGCTGFGFAALPQSRKPTLLQY